MKSSSLIRVAGLVAMALLAGCESQKDAESDASGGDPILNSALAGQIMVDPDLSGKSGAAVSTGTSSVELPPEQRSPEAIAAAKAEAARMVGGVIQHAPPAEAGSANIAMESMVTAARVAEAAKVGRGDCAGKVSYSMAWVNALPQALEVYPRGAVQEAAGTDGEGCRLRIVNFVTPVAPDDVLDFYYTRVRAAGYSSVHRLNGKGHMLGGNNGKAGYAVFVRTLENGLTEVDLVVGDE